MGHEREGSKGNLEEKGVVILFFICFCRMKLQNVNQSFHVLPAGCSLGYVFVSVIDLSQ